MQDASGNTAEDRRIPTLTVRAMARVTSGWGGDDESINNMLQTAELEAAISAPREISCQR